MLLHWNKERYQKVDTVVSIILLAGIAGFIYAWYFNTLQGGMLIITILPIGLAHWYKRKLEKLLKIYGGAQIDVGNKKLVLLKPGQNYEATINFREITSVKSTRWLFLDKIKLTIKGNREIELINFHDQTSILGKIMSN
jgi:hypothetical protein